MQPETVFLRVNQIVGDPKASPPIPAIIPVSKSTWWNWVAEGKAPKPIKLGERVTVWKKSDVLAMCESLQGGSA